MGHVRQLTWAAIANVAAANAGGNVFCALSPDWFKQGDIDLAVGLQRFAACG